MMFRVILWQHGSCNPRYIGRVTTGGSLAPSIISIQPGPITAYYELLGNPQLLLRLLLGLRAGAPLVHLADLPGRGS